MPSSTPILPVWARSASFSLAVHAGVLGAFLIGSSLGSVRGTERAGREPSLHFVARTPPAAAPAEARPEPLPALERERRVEPTLVRPVPAAPEPLEPLPEARSLARVEFLPRAFERIRPDELRRRPVPVPEAPVEHTVAESVPRAPEGLAPEPDRPGTEAGLVVLPEPCPGACPEPTYPARALRRGLGGSVLCRIDIAADGRVSAVTVDRSSGHDALDRAAREALLSWRFEPGSRNGRPCAMEVWKRIDFQLPR